MFGFFIVVYLALSFLLSVVYFWGLGDSYFVRGKSMGRLWLVFFYRG